MIKRTRSLAATAGALCALTALAVAGPAVGAASKGKADSGVSYVAITHKAGGFEYVAGNTTDKILGVGAVTYKVKIGPSTAGKYQVSAPSVVVYTSTGSLSGTASATLTIASGGTETFSNGKISLTKGAGSQAGHSLTATFTGTGNAVAGSDKFVYKGTYK